MRIRLLIYFYIFQEFLNKLNLFSVYCQHISYISLSTVKYICGECGGLRKLDWLSSRVNLSALIWNCLLPDFEHRQPELICKYIIHHRKPYKCAYMCVFAGMHVCVVARMCCKINSFFIYFITYIIVNSGCQPSSLRISA